MGQVVCGGEAWRRGRYFQRFGTSPDPDTWPVLSQGGVGNSQWRTRRPSDRHVLASVQNIMAGYESTHVPMTWDPVAAEVRAVNMHFPQEKLADYSSDLAKAYKQIPEDPVDVESVILTQFEPETDQLAHCLPLTLLFGDRWVTLVFTRFTPFSDRYRGGASVHCHAALHGRPSQHRTVTDSVLLPEWMGCADEEDSPPNT